MTREDFERDLRRARAYRDTAEGMERDYWLGYERGLRRAFYGAQFGTDSEHRLWLTLAGSEDLSRPENARVPAVELLTVRNDDYTRRAVRHAAAQVRNLGPWL